MSNYLSKVVYLTDSQYATLCANHNTTIGGHKYDPNALYITNTAGDADTVNGHTVNIDVPFDAIFTDTNKYHSSGSWNGLTYTANSIGGAETLAFTLQTGTTATTVAVGNHTHGNLTNDGKITTTATIANGDKLVIVDSDSTAASKITGSSITFDGSTTTDCLTKKGTWTALNVVKQTLKDDNVEYKILGTTASSTTNTGQNVFDTGITWNPSTHTITATTFSGNVAGTITQVESTSNYDRPIWFCDHNGTDVVLGKPGYNNNFKYNPSNRTIKFSDSAVIQTTSNNLTLNAAGSFYLHCASTAYIINGNTTSLIFRRVNGSDYSEYARFNTSGNLIIGLSDAQNDFTLARILVENHDANSANDIKGNSQMTISNSNGGNVGIELRRGALSGDTKDQSGAASWKISVESGEFRIKSDYPVTGGQLTNYGHIILNINHRTGLATFSNSVDISEALSVTGNIWGGSSSASSECDVGVRGVAGKIFFWSAASASGDKGIWIKNTNETNTSTLFTVNQSNQIKAMATIACQIKVAYTTASGNTSIPMIELTDSAAVGTAAANSWMRGLHHIVTNLAVGGHTCFITGKALSQNKAAVLSFNYNNASTLTNNTIGLGLYGNENLLIIDGNGRATAKSFATDGTQAAQIYLGRTSLTNWIQTPTTSSISFCIHDTLNESNASLKITGSTLTCYSNEKSSLGTSTVQWNGTYSKFYVVDKNVTLQWNSTDQSLDFIFA